MKRVIIASALATLIALPGCAIAQSHDDIERDDIMAKVIWPCVQDAVSGLDLPEHQHRAAAHIMLEINRDYYEEIIDGVEEALRENPGDAAEWSCEAGLALCIEYQWGWMER